MSLYITEQCIGCGACLRICPVEAVAGKPKKRHEIDSQRCIECSACGRVCPSGSVVTILGEVIEQQPRSQWDIPHIDPKQCTGCGVCAETCPAGVLEMEEAEGRRIAQAVHPGSCVSCEWCLDNCMFSAIEMKPRGTDAVRREMLE